MKFSMSEAEDTPVLFWGLMLHQKTVAFVYLEKAISPEFFKNGKTLRQISTEAQKAIWGEALGSMPVISHKSDFKE